MGGRGTGKTVVGVVYLLFNAMDGNEAIAVSPTYGVIDETTFPTFLDVARKAGKLIRHKQSPTPKVWFRTKDGGQAEVTFRSGEDPEKLRGPSKSILWLDECSVMHNDVFKLGLPILRHEGKMGKCLMTFTPKGRSHWTFKEFFDLYQPSGSGPETRKLYQFGQNRYTMKDHRTLIHARTSENPFVAEEFESLISGIYSSAMREQELGGDFVDIAGLLFDRGNFASIPDAQSPREAMRVRYWDRAATPGSGCYTAGCLMSMPISKKPYPWIIEHVVRGQWGPAERDAEIRKWAEYDRDKYGGEVVIYIEQEGGSGGKEIAGLDVMKLAGFPVYIDRVGSGVYRKKDGLYLPGPAKVVRAMALSSQVEQRNVAVVQGAWNEAYLDEMASFPESSFADQCLIAGTKVTLARGDTPIEQVRSGDFALTRGGWQRVIEAGMTSAYSSTIRVDLSSGESLQGTPNHPVFVVGKGFIPLVLLQPGDSLCRENSRFIQAEIAWNSMVPRSFGTPNRHESTCGTTSGADGTGSRPASIEPSGCFTTVQSSRLKSSITKTETLSTTPSKTLNSSPMPNTSESTLDGAIFQDLKQSPTSNRSGHSQQNGMDPPKESNGIERTESTAPPSEGSPQSSSSASVASHSHLPGQPSTAAKSALNSSVDQEPKSGIPAENAGRHFFLFERNSDSAGTPALVLRVTRGDAQPVYNLAVEDFPEYFANGFLVHNCDATSGAFNKLTNRGTMMDLDGPSSRPGPSGIGVKILEMQRELARNGRKFS